MYLSQYNYNYNESTCRSHFGTQQYLGKVSQKALQDGEEHVLEAVLGGWRQSEHGEVTQEARGDWIATSTRRGTRGRQSDFLNVDPEELVTVVQAAEVLILTQQFNGRLRAVTIQLRHVQIVDKDDDTLALLRRERSLCESRN